MKTRKKPTTTTTSARDFLEQSLNWPRWPMLPMMARGDCHGEEACGFLFSYSAEPEPVVYFGNVFRMTEVAAEVQAETGKDTATWGELLAKLKHRRFASLDEVLVHYRVD